MSPFTPKDTGTARVRDVSGVQGANRPLFLERWGPKGWGRWTEDTRAGRDMAMNTGTRMDLERITLSEVRERDGYQDTHSHVEPKI